MANDIKTYICIWLNNSHCNGVLESTHHLNFKYENKSSDFFRYYFLPQELLNKAILASVAARKEWDLKPVADRAQIFFKAADIISGPKRAEILAKTMIGQVL